jgi:hypothetical protein
MYKITNTDIDKYIDFDFLFSALEKEMKQHKCSRLEELQFSNQNVGNKLAYDKLYSQVYYLLRFAPYYYEEYKIIWNIFLLKTKLKDMKVLSVGSGAFLDFYALNYLFKENKNFSFEYFGVDKANWQKYKNIYQDQKLLKKIIFYNNDFLNKQEDFNLENINVLFFPKSITEFYDLNEESSKNKVFDAIFEQIKKIKSKEFYIILSLVNRREEKGKGTGWKYYFEPFLKEKNISYKYIWETDVENNLHNQEYTSLKIQTEYFEKFPKNTFQPPECAELRKQYPAKYLINNSQNKYKFKILKLTQLK